MAVVSVVGDAATTTTLALASCWSADDAILVEADPAGGSIAAWLDVPTTPSLSSLVAARHRAEADGAAPSAHRELLDSMVRRAPGGMRYVPCPFTAREASRTVAEADAFVFPALAADDGTVLLDGGRATSDLAARVVQSDLVVAVHHQRHVSARAAAAQLERFAETIDSISARRAVLGLGPPVVAVIGDRPFDPGEILVHVGEQRTRTLLTLADDPMSAAVLAGRPGVSERRLRRQPLLRDARRAATQLAEILRSTPTPPGVARDLVAPSGAPSTSADVSPPRPEERS